MLIHYFRLWGRSEVEIVQFGTKLFSDNSHPIAARIRSIQNKVSYLKRILKRSISAGNQKRKKQETNKNQDRGIQSRGRGGNGRQCTWEN